MEFNDSNLFYSAHKALLYNIFEKIRMISMESNSDSSFLLKCIVTNKLNKDELDIIFSIVGEITGDFNQIIKCNPEIEVDKHTSINKLKHYKYMLFARYEENDKVQL